MGRVVRIVCGAMVLAGAGGARAQYPPGPFQFIPIADPFIVEAWRDLEAGSSIADWTGYRGNLWISPRAYNTHEGTDWATQTNTAVYAPAAGRVSEVVSHIPASTGTGLGNYVRVELDEPDPDGRAIDVIVAHLLPGALVGVGQRVEPGTRIGRSDDTGNSTSEHVHLESRERGGAAYCPFHYGHWRYPIIHNPEGTTQVGFIVRVKRDNVPVRADRYPTSTVLTTVHAGQLYFATYWKNGHYAIHLPNTTTSRGGFVAVQDAEEVDEGTVLQAMPDTGAFVYTQPLAAPIALRDAPDTAAPVTAQVIHGGARVVADQTRPDGWYRIAVPGSTPTWKWTQITGGTAGPRVIVYPERRNPGIPSDRFALQRRFPVVESFTTTGKTPFGRPKFNRPEVRSFAPPAPNGGDGRALFMTDAMNVGDGPYDSLLVGRPDAADYMVQADVYLSYKPTQGGWERYGILARDDGFGGVDRTFEGGGNAYAMLWDSDDGRLRCARVTTADGSSPVVTDFRQTNQIYITQSGWRTMRIECRGTTIRYLLDGELLVSATDTTFASGPAGLGYSNRTTSNPAGRGAWFDNLRVSTYEPESWFLY